MNPCTIKAIIDANLGHPVEMEMLLLPAIADELKTLGIDYTFQTDQFFGINQLFLELNHPFVTKITMMGSRIDLHHKDDCDAPEFFMYQRQWKAKLKRWLTEDFNGRFF